MSDFLEFGRWLFSQPPWAYVMFGALLLTVVLPAAFEAFDWRS